MLAQPGLSFFQGLEYGLSMSGLFPNPEGPSLGITNIKQGAFDAVVNMYSDQFKGVTIGQLMSDQGLDIKVTAYYLRYLMDKYVANAPSVLRGKYIVDEIVYGIYNGGEDNYRGNVLGTRSFRPSCFT